MRQEERRDGSGESREGREQKEEPKFRPSDFARVFGAGPRRAAVMMKAVRPAVPSVPLVPPKSEASEAAFMATREGGILTTPLGATTRTDERGGYFICIIWEFQSAAIIVGGKFRLSPQCGSSRKNFSTAEDQGGKYLCMCM